MAEFSGTPGNDLLVGTSGNDIFSWLGGNDTIDGGAGFDMLYLGYSATALLVDLPAGTITIDDNILSVTRVEGVSLDGNASHFIGDDADNRFSIFGGNTTMSGGGGNDRLSWDGSGNLVFLDGGAGDDLLEVFGMGTVSVSGGTGLDRVMVLSSLQGANPATISLNPDGGLTLEGRGTTLSIAPDIEEIAFYFDINPDLTMLTLSFAEVAALAPSFHIGTEGNDVLTGTGLRDQINGLGGNDWLLPGAGRDSIDGGAGVDMLSYAGLEDGPVFVYLEGGFSHKLDVMTYSYVGSDRFTSIEGVTGTGYNDYLVGFDGSDTLRGGRGDDTLVGSAGADVFDGGSGRDSADYYRSVAVGEQDASGINASLLRGRGWTGDAAGDRYSGIEDLVGSILDDHLAGDHAANRLYGMHGDDTLIGLGGDDYIYGGMGTDTAKFGYDRDQYSITQAGLLTTVTYIGAGTGDGTDTLLSVEQLQFADELVIL